MPLTGVYNSSVPQGNQQVNNTQSPIRTNFYDIYDLFKVNHGVLQTEGSPSPNEGMHTVISYINQTTDPQTGSDDVALYAKNVGGDDNLMELFVRYPNNGSIVQVTGDFPGTYATDIQSTLSSEDLAASSGSIELDSLTGFYNGYQYVAGGVIMMFGFYQLSISSTALQTSTLSFPTFANFSGFSATPFHMEMCHCNDSNSDQLEAPYGEIYITPTSSTTFDLTYEVSPLSVGSTTFYWLAIGV